MDQRKTCGRCNEPKPLDDFYFKNKRTGTRLSYCIDCYKQMGAARYLERKGDRPNITPSHYYRDRDATEKTCSRCQQTLPIEQFAIQRPATGARRGLCQPCHNAANLEHKRANRERLREQGLAYYAANRDLILAKLKRYREEHPEADKATHRKWKSANKDMVNAATHRRRNKVAENGGHWTAEQWQALKADFDYHCLLCWRQEPEITLTVDHVVPVSLGGSNDISNLQPLCKSCNSLKHRQTLDLRPAARQQLAQERA